MPKPFTYRLQRGAAKRLRWTASALTHAADYLAPSPRQVFGRLDDAAWLNTLIASIAEPVQNGVRLPGFPDAALQIATVGSANETAIKEHSLFYSLIREACAAHSRPIGAQTAILDFGVSWGRTVRFFLRDTDAAYLHGVDVNDQFLNAARETRCPATLQKIDPLGSLPYTDATFDLIYSYSVFTHLPEAVADRWLSEIRRTLKPGGMFVATVESPRFIERRLNTDPNDETLHPRERRLARILADEPQVRARLIEHGVTHVPMSDTYGDTMIRPEYLHQHWGQFFDVLEFVDEPARLWQAAAICQRR